MPDEPRYSLSELADLAGVTPRTVRYYLAYGLLPSVGQPGPGAKYGDDHLDRLRLIRRLQRDHLPLAEIRRRLADLDPDSIHDLAESDSRPEPGESALDYVRSVLDASRPTLRRAVPMPPASAPGPLPSVARSSRAIRVAEALGDIGPTPMTVERSQWERIVLAPDVELHVRRPSSRTQNKQVDRLVTIARELLEEE